MISFYNGQKRNTCCPIFLFTSDPNRPKMRGLPQKHNRVQQHCSHTDVSRYGTIPHQWRRSARKTPDKCAPHRGSFHPYCIDNRIKIKAASPRRAVNGLREYSITRPAIPKTEPYVKIMAGGIFPVTEALLRVRAIFASICRSKSCYKQCRKP